MYTFIPMVLGKLNLGRNAISPVVKMNECSVHTLVTAMTEAPRLPCLIIHNVRVNGVSVFKKTDILYCWLTDNGRGLGSAFTPFILAASMVLITVAFIGVPPFGEASTVKSLSMVTVLPVGSLNVGVGSSDARYMFAGVVTNFLVDRRD